jgi:hypothetical protein
MPVAVPFEHEPSKSMSVSREKRITEEITEISASPAFLTLPMEKR